MKINKAKLREACQNIDLGPETADQLWTELEKENTSKFDVEHLAYYFGAMIVMSAMGWFMTKAWDDMGGLAISLLGAVYMFVFLVIGWFLWYRKELKVAGGLLFTMAVWMIPLVVFGIEKYTGLWARDQQTSFHAYHVWVNGSWIIMEIATIVGGLIVIGFIRFPFLTFPIAFSLWYMSMDLTPLIFGKEDYNYKERALVSVYFGLIMIVLSYLVDRLRPKQDFAFWGYLFGMLAFWGGLSMIHSDTHKFTYCLINLLLIVISILIQRKVFIVFGSIGVFSYLGYLSYDVFKDSTMFPIALSALGIIIIFLGVVYNRNKKRIEDTLQAVLPVFILKLNPEYTEPLPVKEETE